MWRKRDKIVFCEHLLNLLTTSRLPPTSGRSICCTLALVRLPPLTCARSETSRYGETRKSRGGGRYVENYAEAHHPPPVAVRTYRAKKGGKSAEGLWWRIARSSATRALVLRALEKVGKNETDQVRGEQTRQHITNPLLYRPQLATVDQREASNSAVGDMRGQLEAFRGGGNVVVGAH